MKLDVRPNWNAFIPRKNTTYKNLVLSTLLLKSYNITFLLLTFFGYLKIYVVKKISKHEDIL